MDVNAESEADAREERHIRILACMSGVATGLLVAAVLFFAVYDRAELQFLFSKPTVQNGNSATVAVNATPDNTVARK